MQTVLMIGKMRRTRAAHASTGWGRRASRRTPMMGVGVKRLVQRL